MVRRTIHNLEWLSFGPSHWELDLPPLAGLGSVTVSFVEDGWLQFLELRGQISSTMYPSRDAAMEPIAYALGAI